MNDTHLLWFALGMFAVPIGTVVYIILIEKIQDWKRRFE